jgi:malonyl-CoA O-methyltransferase
MINKDIIKKHFSKCARYYDRYSTVQNLCASKLIAKIKANSFNKILDIGCGTGNYTKLLREKFPGASIKAVDMSPEMIEIAKEKLRDEVIEFIVADGEVIDFNEPFDLISSNASFQWFEDLEKTLSRYKRLLNENGVILFSVFGPLTFYELDRSLKELVGEDATISSCYFLKRAEIEKILKCLFKEIEIEQKIYKENYNSLSELLKKIKYTGTKGNGLNKKRFWTPKIANDLEKIYIRKSKNITATYQVFFCRGVKQ